MTRPRGSAAGVIGVPVMVLVATAGLLSVGSAESQEPAAGGDAVLSAAVRVDLRGQGPAWPVEIRYQLSVDPATRAIPITLLQLPPLRVEGLEATVGGLPAGVRLDDPGEGRAIGSILLGGSTPRELTVVLHYRVGSPEEHPLSRGARIPLLVVDWSPRDPGPETFSAEALTLADVSLAEAFPTRVVSAVGPESATHRITLQVVPAFVRYRAADGLALSTVVDAGVVLLLLVLGVIGFRSLLALERRALSGSEQGRE